LQQMVGLAASAPVRTDFSSTRAACLDMTGYVARLHTRFQCSRECFVIATIYIDRVCKQHPQVVVDAPTCQRLLACSLTLAAKFHDDDCSGSHHYAKVCGLPLRELAELEASLLRLLGFCLFIGAEEFDTYRQILIRAGGPWHRPASSKLRLA